MEKLPNKVALVTGGNSGTRLATAKLLREQGPKAAPPAEDVTMPLITVKEI